MRVYRTFSHVQASILMLAVLSVGSRSADAAGLLIADGGLGGKLESRSHDVHVTINNGVAVTEVEQIFLNTEQRIVEALYVFPVPRGASVSNFSMWINGQEMIGEVVEKERARQIYESYKQVRRDPGLLEQVDYKRFEMRIFPIAAGAEQRVKVTYYQELDFDHDAATYVYPLATTADRGGDTRVDGKFALTLDVRSEVPIRAIASTSHASDFVTTKHTPTYAQASMELGRGDLSRDIVIHFETERPRSGVDIITSKPADEDGFFQLTITAGDELAQVEQGMDYVFVLDISGSMANDGKMRLSRESIGSFITSLAPEDRFEIITFNVTPNSLFRQMTPCDPVSLERATSFLQTQQARGGTVLRPALSTAYQYHTTDRVLNVVLLSDGMTEQTEQQELIALIGQRPAGTRVFCVGVGNEVNRPLLQQLAEDAGGLAAFVSEQDDFARQAERFRRKTTRPAMTNLRLDFADGDVYDIEPARIPHLYHGAPVRVYGRYRKAGKTNITISGEVLGKPFEQSVAAKLPERDDSNPEIERMWAMRRVDALLADQRAQGVDGKHRPEIVRLCEGFSIVSPYASFIVLENDAEYQRWSIERRNATRVTRDRSAQQLVRRELQRLRDQAVANIGPAAERSDRDVLAQAKSHAGAPSDPASGPFDPSASAPGNSTPADDSPGFDFSIPGSTGSGAGGGAVDPVTALIVLSAAGAAWTARRRRRS